MVAVWGLCSPASLQPSFRGSAKVTGQYVYGYILFLEELDNPSCFEPNHLSFPGWGLWGCVAQSFLTPPPLGANIRYGLKFHNLHAYIEH